ncbi:MAG: hypothetical protein J6B64_01840 [Bacilli bacterium]|nr:hypothetical protein [Bacilli bacterium]MBP3921297.1 hypothetical protein [Bacilli bacterium]
MEVKELKNYDLDRVLSRVDKEYGKIERGCEEFYNPQLDYIEQEIYKIHNETPISDYELQIAILIIIYDLKGYVDKIKYDYNEIVDEHIINFAHKLEKLFNPFINGEIKITEYALSNLKQLFTLPIMCLSRIYHSIDFWKNRYGKDGYYKMLEEMVVPVKHIGEFPYALEEEFLIK